MLHWTWLRIDTTRTIQWTPHFDKTFTACQNEVQYNHIFIPVPLPGYRGTHETVHVMYVQTIKSVQKMDSRYERFH